MESEVKQLLSLVLLRLDKLQQQQDLHQHRLSQLDHVTERLDTVQNVLETQNQRHGLLNEKLDQVNIILREQLRYAQSDILTGITVLQSKLCSDGGKQHVSQSVNKDQVPQTKYGPQFEDTASNLSGRLNKLETKVDTLKNLLSENTRSSHKVIEMILRMETQLQSVVQQEQGKEKGTASRQKELQVLQDGIKALTRAEMVWLEKKVDVALVDMSAKLNEKLEKVTTKVTEQYGPIQDKLSEQQNFLENVRNVAEKMQENLGHIQTTVDQNKKMTVVVKSFSAANNLRERLTAAVQECPTSQYSTGTEESDAKDEEVEDEEEEEEAEESLETEQMQESIVILDENVQKDLKDFCNKMKDEVLSKIQVEIEKSVKQATDRLKQYLGSKNSEIIKHMKESSDTMISSLEDTIQTTNSFNIKQIHDNIKTIITPQMLNTIRSYLKESSNELTYLVQQSSLRLRNESATNFKYLEALSTDVQQNGKSVNQSVRHVKDIVYRIENKICEKEQQEDTDTSSRKCFIFVVIIIFAFCMIMGSSRHQ